MDVGHTVSVWMKCREHMLCSYNQQEASPFLLSGHPKMIVHGDGHFPM